MDKKLSTMMMLGSTMLDQRDASKYLEQRDGKWCGCAIGMACLAMGESTGTSRHHLFPWLSSSPEGTSLSYDLRISSMFRTVCGDTPSIYGDRPMASLEEIVDWVRGVEPECGECNSFECTCVPAVVAEESTAAAV